MCLFLTNDYDYNVDDDDDNDGEKGKKVGQLDGNIC